MSVYVLNKISHLYDWAIFIQNFLGCAVIPLLCGALITALASLDSKNKGSREAEKSFNNTFDYSSNSIINTNIRIS